MEEEHLEMTDKSIHELQKLMMWISEIGKKQVLIVKVSTKH
ncbi:UNVERIFIED_ORG: hypothetical protein [Escherichia phage CMSTMSU]